MTGVTLRDMRIGQRFTWLHEECNCEGYVNGDAEINGHIAVTIDKQCDCHGRTDWVVPAVFNVWADRVVLLSDFMDAMERIEA